MTYLSILSQMITFFCLIFMSSCNIGTEEKESTLSGPYFGITPTNTPQLLAPELIASPAEEYNGTFSPDGTEFYYTTDIPENAFITVTKLQQDNTWSEPVVAEFSGQYSDYDPLFTPDGKRLYFSSSRPEGDNQNSKIFYVERNGASWGEPQRVQLTNEENNEYYSSVTNDGTIYFNIWSTGNIFKAMPTDSSYTISKVDTVINAAYDKGDPFISPKEDYIIFRGYRNDRLGRGDLYISFNINGEWTRPENLGEPINSSAHEICPYVTPDGRIFIFASARVESKLKLNPNESIGKVHKKYRSYDNGELNIYYMSADFIKDMRAKYEQ